MPVLDAEGVLGWRAQDRLTDVEEFLFFQRRREELLHVGMGVGDGHVDVEVRSGWRR